MHTLSVVRRSSSVRCFLILFAVAFAWALYTQHAWEDYYITYRASKNLATGHGLTFTVGERVHSFTSPLGVLLPAVASLLTGNSSDTAALWIFRLMSIVAYAGAGVFLWQLARTLYSTTAGAVLLIALLATDTKIVDFSTNGMETGFLLFFLAWTLYALFTAPPRQALHLGLSWAGLMWSRPDSFIYIGVLVTATAVFRPRAAAPQTRLQFLKTVAGAGVITTVLYAPWLLWAWAYYGNPVPHTIIAKGLFGEKATFTTLWRALSHFPAKVASYPDILMSTFMPAYSINAGWPKLGYQVSYWVSLALMAAWGLPKVRPEARVATLAFLAGEFYLNTYVQFPVPWYIPTLTLFALFVVTSVFDQLLSQPRLRALAPWLAILPVAGALSIFLMSAYQLRWQQRIVEEGQRAVIGKWLRVHAATPHDTVFLEPLGYIGFYSNLKMLDYPGLCSPEVVAARKRAKSHSYPFCWPELMLALLPDWIVLRGYESESLHRDAPEIFTRYYTFVRTFDVRDQVNAVPHIPGRSYLLNDALFEVYRRNPGLTRNSGPGKIVGVAPIKAKDLLVAEGWGQKPYDSGENIVSHAPARLVAKKTEGAGWLVGGFGLFDGAYANPANSTDGAEFTVTYVKEDGGRIELLRRLLKPQENAADRGTQSFNISLPSRDTGTIELVVSPGPNGSNAFDWAYWSGLAFELPR